MRATWRSYLSAPPAARPYPVKVSALCARAPHHHVGLSRCGCPARSLAHQHAQWGQGHVHSSGWSCGGRQASGRGGGTAWEACTPPPPPRRLTFPPTRPGPHAAWPTAGGQERLPGDIFEEGLATFFYKPKVGLGPRCWCPPAAGLCRTARPRLLPTAPLRPAPPRPLPPFGQSFPPHPTFRWSWTR
jgi:hypothetical protein